MSELVKVTQDLPAVQEANALENLFSDDAGFDKMLKFGTQQARDKYFADGQEVPLGTVFLAHCVGAAKRWIKFVDGKMAEQRTYRAGQVPAERDELDDNDPMKWPSGLDDKPADPWVMQSLLPLENETGELFVFITRSWGGRRAVGNLMKSYNLRTRRTGKSEQPYVKLGKSSFPSKKYGNVASPVFEIVSWDSVKEGKREIKGLETLTEEMDDQIPF